MASPVYKGQVFRLELQGFDELEKALGELPKSLRKGVLTRTLRAAAKPIRDEMVANVPQGPTGNLRKSIIVSPKRIGKRIKSKRSVFMFVGPDARLGPHAHLVEYGTGPREVKNKKIMKGKDGKFYGQVVGPMPPQPFVRPAWQRTRWKAFDIIKKEMWAQILKTAKTLARKAERGTLGKSAVKALRG
jgi:HK97 gp10 family phage protein